MKKTKILFLSKETRGGTGTFLNQIYLLDPKKYTCRFYFFKEEKDFIFESKYSILRSATYPNHFAFSMDKIFISIFYFFSVYNVVKRENPDIIFVCDLYPFLITTILKLFTRISYPIFYFMNLDIFRLIEDKPNKLYQWTLKQVSLYLLSQISQLIFPSKGLQEAIYKKMSKKEIPYVVIPYGINIPRFNKNIPKKSSDFTIISIGRLDNQKDIQTILKAFHMLSSKYQKMKLTILGDGEQENYIKSTIKKLHLEKKIFLEGWQLNIHSFLNKADIFVFSSFYEGFGMVILEAMAAKVPVIATDSPFGPGEILDKGKFGRLIPVGDYKAMAKEIEKLYSNSKIYIHLQKNGYTRAKQFSIKKMLLQYEKILKT